MNHASSPYVAEPPLDGTTDFLSPVAIALMTRALANVRTQSHARLIAELLGLPEDVIAGYIAVRKRKRIDEAERALLERLRGLDGSGIA